VNAGTRERIDAMGNGIRYRFVVCDAMERGI